MTIELANALDESVHGLLRLHELDLAGLGDSQEADAVRDRLDAPWHALTNLEKQRIEGLSEDLYSVAEPPVRREMNPQARRGWKKAFEAKQSGRLDEALGLLRRWQSYFDPGICQYLRGSIWIDLKQPAVSTVFFREATRLAPTDDKFYFMYLHALSLVDVKSATSAANEILANPDETRAGIIVKSCEIVFMAVRRSDDAIAREAASRIIARLVSILPSLITHAESRLFYPMALSIAAFCSEMIGDKQGALDFYDDAIAVDPYNEALLTARGILRYGSDSQSFRDFKRAIDGGAQMVWPYFYLAHDAFLRTDLEACKRYVEIALDLPAPQGVRANLLEWLGIVRFEMDGDIEGARDAFRQAMELAPENQRIRRNYAVFEAAARDGSREVVWTKELAEAVRSLGQREFRKTIEPRVAIAA